MLVLLVVAALSRRLRTAATGVAVGVLLHFVRDVATGPGLPLASPLCSGGALLPYGLNQPDVRPLVSRVRSPAATGAALITAAAGNANWAN